MGKHKKHENEEPFISRSDLMKKRQLSERFIRESLKEVEYNFGHRTKRYKLTEVDNFLKQKKAG